MSSSPMRFLSLRNATRFPDAVTGNGDISSE